MYSVAALDRTTQGTKEKIEYHQPGVPQATVPALPPLTSRMLDPEDSNEVSRQDALPDLLSSLPSDFLYPCDQPNYEKLSECFGLGQEPDEGTVGRRGGLQHSSLRPDRASLLQQ